MDRILRILLAVAIFGGGDSITRTESLNRRYGGGGNKRPSSSSDQSQMYSPPMGDYSYNSVGGGGNMYGASLYIPQSSSYGQSHSYSRPFGLPEGLNFPSVGHTHKLPQVPPPLPPVKAKYMSKPYPDYVIRFKSPLYPSEVTVYDKPRPSSSGLRPLPPSYPPGPVPVYESSPPSKAPIPIYGSPPESDKQVVTVVATNQDVNVGTSYQTNGNLAPDGQYGFANFNPSGPIYGNVPASPHNNPVSAGLGSLENLRPDLGSFENFRPDLGSLENLRPASLPPYATAQPHMAAVYVINHDRLAADKLQTGSFELVSNSFAHGTKPNKNDGSASFVGLSQESVYGSSPELGVIKPLTPDVVYTPNNPNSNENFKPMYIFGPVYFPKPDGIARDNAESGSSNSVLKSAAVAPNCTKTEGSPVDPNCLSVADATVDEAPATAAPVPLPPATETSNARDEEDDEDDFPSSSGGRGRRRGGILRVVEKILGLDEEHDDSLSRADDEENIETDQQALDEEATVDQDADYDSRDSAVSSNRESSGKRKQKTRTRTRNTGNSRHRTRYSDSSKTRSRGQRPKTSLSRGTNRDEEEMRTAEDKRQTGVTILKRPSGISRDPGVVIAQPDEEDGHMPPLDSDDDGPDPIIGPVQIGYIGQPPPGMQFNPMQPFFYPAGIAPFSNNFAPSAHGFEDENEPKNNDNSAANPPNSSEQEHGSINQNGPAVVESNSEVYEDSQPPPVSPSDLSVAPAAVLEQPLPQETPLPSAVAENSEKVDNPLADSHIQSGQEGNLQSSPDLDPTNNLQSSPDLDPTNNLQSIPDSDPTNNLQPSPDSDPTNNLQPSPDSDPTNNLIPYDQRYPEYDAGSILKKQQSYHLSAAESVQDGINDRHFETPPQHEIATSSDSNQYHQYTTKEDPYPTYPQTNSYAGDFETTSTAYADNFAYENAVTSHENSNPITSDHLDSLHTPQYHDVNQDINNRATGHNDLNAKPHYAQSQDENVIGETEELADKKGITSATSGVLYDYTNSGSLLHSDDRALSTSESYQDYPEETSTESSTAATTTQNSYSSVSRRPFPSFHRYRNRSRYQPKNTNYIPPTTYRPAYHTGGSTATKDTFLADDTDSSANIYNSLHYDISPVTTSAPPALAASYRLEAAKKSATLAEIGEFPKHPQYGDRVIPKENTFDT